MKLKNYQVGNSKKLKWATSRFRQNATIHGLGYFFQKESSCCSSCLWKTLLVFCLIGVSSSLYEITRGFSKSAQYISTTEKEYDYGPDVDELFPSFPQLTICRKPPWSHHYNSSTIRMLEYGFLALGYPYDSILPEDADHYLNAPYPEQNVNVPKEIMDAINSYEIYVKDNNIDALEFIKNHSIKCEDIFISCVFMFYEPFDCCNYFEPVLTASGMCYAFHPNEKWLVKDPGSVSGSPFSIDMHTHQYRKNPYPASQYIITFHHKQSKQMQGFTITASHPKEDIHLIDPANAEYLQTSAVTNLKISLTLINRKASYTPWYFPSTVCPSQPSFLQHNERLRERFDVRACEVKNYYYSIAKYCNCNFILFPGEDKNLGICGPMKAYICVVEILKRFEEIELNETSDPECSPPCFQYQFHMSSSTANIGNENIARLIFRFNNNNFMLKTVESKSLTYFISQAGGALGLYLGASIVTVVEVLVFVVLCVWYRFVPLKRKKISDRWEVTEHFKKKSKSRINS